MLKVERFDQSRIKTFNRQLCTKEITRNPNTSYAAKGRCMKDAQFYIDGNLMCSAHAGQTLLEEALKNAG